MSVMAKATWEGIVLAESNQTIEIEGNHYFPPGSIRSEFFRPTDHHTLCIWKGTASYYDLEVNGKRNPEPKSDASIINNYIAFWRGVNVEK